MLSPLVHGVDIYSFFQQYNESEWSFLHQIILLGFQSLESTHLKYNKSMWVLCLQEVIVTVFVYLPFPLCLCREQGRSSDHISKWYKLSHAQSITCYLLDVFISFTEFPTCEPLTQFVCKSGRCISSKWHCDSGKYQMLTV